MVEKQVLQFPIVIPAQPAQDNSPQHLAIVPYRPCMPAELLRFWAETIAPSVTRTLTLPSVVSMSNPRAFLEDSSCRCSTRQSTARNGFQHIQLEDHPRKRRCTWVEVSAVNPAAEHLLNNPPNQAEQVLGQLPNDLLQNRMMWCGA